MDLLCFLFRGAKLLKVFRSISYKFIRTVLESY